MAVIAVLHSDPVVRDSIRRSARRPGLRVVNCRSVARIERLVGEALVDGIVLDIRAGLGEAACSFVQRYPTIPVFAYSSFRPDDGPVLEMCFTVGVKEVLVGGVDDSVVGERIHRGSAGMARRRDLEDAPRLLRLTEELQLRAWDQILDHVESPVRTEELARALGVSREYLSREFAAGGAPNLKRVIDLTRLACAAQFLANPGYSVAEVATILGYSSSSHLAGNARRIADVRPIDLPALGPRGVLTRFRRGRTRSRL